MTKFYQLLKDMPFHAKGSLLVCADKWYIWETGLTTEQYALPVEIVENCPEWFEEAFPNWVQNEPCWFISFSGIVVRDYFDRNKHSALARFGNLFKSEADAEIMNTKLSEIFEPFADVVPQPSDAQVSSPSSSE